jgi:small subunit ribosomal protein S6
MSKYELTVVIPGKSTPAKKKSVRSVVEKLIKTFNGKIEKSDDWGERELAHPIKKNDSGMFMHLIVELKSDSAKSIVQKLNLEEEIIRYLLVSK